MSMEATPASGSFAQKATEPGEIEAAQEVNLDISTTSEEEAAAIESRKEKLRHEIKEVYYCKPFFIVDKNSWLVSIATILLQYPFFVRL